MIVEYVHLEIQIMNQIVILMNVANVLVVVILIIVAHVMMMWLMTVCRIVKANGVAIL